VRRGLPAVLDLRQVRARVVTGHLWVGRETNGPMGTRRVNELVLMVGVT
jgi:hypothetical protein